MLNCERCGGPGPVEEFGLADGDIALCKSCLLGASKNDPVNHPSHYTDGKIEVIDFIEDKKFGFHLGNAVKYICRAGKKDPSKTVEDLKKGRWYLDREIQRLEALKAGERKEPAS